MHCCDECFTDKVLQKRIRDRCKSGYCDFCSEFRDFVYSLDGEDTSLQDNVSGIINLYRQAKNKEKGRSLTSCLMEDWDIFAISSPAILTRLLEEFQASSGLFEATLLTEKVVLRASTKDAVLSGKQWSDFSEYIKFNNRFHVPFINVKALDAFIDFLSFPISDTRVLYRARISHDSRRILPKNMGAPPKGKASAGRINPEGVRELYLADTPDTAIHEIRAGMYNHICVGKFQLKRELTVVDLSAFSSIGPFDLEDLIEPFAANKKMLKDVAAEVAKPISSSDDLIQYVPTQYLAEYIKNLGKDGVMYHSTLVPDGKNYCLFDPYSCDCVSVHSGTIQEITYTANRKLEPW